MENYVNKIAVVTGSSSGIGAGIAKELAKRGCIVIGIARRLDRLQLLADEINQNPNAFTGRFHPLRCDISDQQQLDDAFTTIEKKYGVPSILVNNAAIVTMKKLEDLDPQTFDAMMKTNVKAMIFAIKKTIGLMTKHSVSGHIINVNSIASHYMPPNETFLMYSSSKMMSRFVTEMVREKIAKQRLDIKISSISPGLVRTEIFNTISYEMPSLSVDDIVKAFIFILNTPPTVLVSEMIITPIHQNTTIIYPNTSNKPEIITHERKAKL